MKYINEYHEGDYCQGIYLCKSKQVLTARTGKTYYSLVLQDKTGSVDTKVFDINSGIDDFEAMDYIDVMGQVSSFQGNIQWKLTRVRKCSEDEYNVDAYMMTSKYNREEMYKELLTIVSCVKNEYLRSLIKKFFVDDKEFIKKFKNHAAAKSVHHSFIGGLLQHTLGVVRTCNYLGDTYSVLDKDLLMTAGLFHDVGKITELAEFPASDYTDDGQLLGHIFIGAELIGNAVKEIPGFPAKLATELRHCILAHHGELEYGSPKKPAIVEAVALNMADNLDAKMQTFEEIFDMAGDNMEWLGFNRIIDSNIRQTNGSKTSGKIS